MEKIERRYIPISELRTVKDGETRKIAGYAAVFDRLSEDLGGFREKIAPGAFKTAIKVSDTRALWNHDSNYVLGRKSSGTLTLREDKDGLKVEIDPPDTQWARDLMTSIDRGDVSQMSFGFIKEKDSWEEKEGQTPVRTLEAIRDLLDVSPVTFPAYPDTQVAMRSLDEWKKSKPPESDDSGEPLTGELPTHKARKRRRLELNEKQIRKENHQNAD